MNSQAKGNYCIFSLLRSQFSMVTLWCVTARFQIGFELFLKPNRA
ncbi:hypothetical protein [Oscillatoria sp. FACHB-1406]|nr:hypothetical protein [Oscillatoria sp. FACHB-1406]